MGDKPKDEYNPNLDEDYAFVKTFVPSDRRDEIDEYFVARFLYGDEARDGATLLCDLARVPSQHRQHFNDKMTEGLVHIWVLALQNIKTWAPQEARAFNNLENGLRTALRAAQAMPAGKLKRLEEGAPPPAPEHWLDALVAMVAACTFVSGKAFLSRRSATAHRRGRPRDASTQAIYIFRTLIEEIANTVKNHDGKLTLTRATETGTWIDALNKLRPHLPGRVIPKKLPLPTIEKIQGRVNSGDYYIPF
jgi:hypothetical protein